MSERGLRVFFDRWYLAAGQPWPQALEQRLAACGAVAVFIGAEGLGPWQQRERDLALDRQGREPGFPAPRWRPAMHARILIIDRL